MDKLIKFLKSFGLNEQEVQKVLKEIPVDQSGLAGTNVAKGIFEKGGKEVSADYPLVTETMVSPFKLDKYKGLTRKETLEKADEALNFLDKELTRTSNLILNQNLQLSPEQKINFANNLRMKRQFEKDLEIFKSKPEAEIIKFETKKPVSKEGIEQLTEEVGLMAPPTTPVGEAQLKLKQVEQGLKDILKNQTKFEDILKDPIESQIRYAQLQRSGLVRAVAREIIEQDIKSGKLKLRPIVEEGMVNPTGSGLDGDPIEVYRLYYGEDALEQLDSLAPDFSKSYTAKDAAKIAREKFPNIQPREKPIREYLTPNEVDEMTRNNPLRKLTREEIEDYEAAIGRSSEEWLSEGTLDEAEKALKRSQDEYAYYSNLYKKGKLDPAPGEQTEDRMKFLQKKLQEASDVKDKRLISPNELKELEELETRFLTKEPIKNEDQTKTLTDFDITDREPNASGGRAGRTQSRGLDYLMGL